MIFSRKPRKKQPNEVFTPRSPQVNPDMYVERPDLEEAIINGVLGTQHIIIHGESGTGKSWLYKRVFHNRGYFMMVANMANASRLGDLNAAFQDRIDRECLARKESYSEEKRAGIDGVIANAEVGHNGHYVIGRKEPFEACLQMLRAEAGDRPACLVLDNFEQVLESKKIIKQVSDVIILLDDDDYAQYGVKLTIVGVPDDIQRYFSQVSNASTVSNRVTEIPEVARLTEAQAAKLVQKGLFEELGLEVGPDVNVDKVVKHITWATDRIPQHLHEYCLKLATISCDKEEPITGAVLAEAERLWLRDSLIGDYTVVESLMNSRETKAGRRNQTIYALGVFDGRDFKASDIEGVVKAEFPASTQDVELNVAQRLSELLGGETPLIRRTPKGDAYRFVSPKYRMCIRAMLKKNDSEKVEKVPIEVVTQAGH